MINVLQTRLLRLRAAQTLWHKVSVVIFSQLCCLPAISGLAAKPLSAALPLWLAAATKTLLCTPTISPATQAISKPPSWL